ncbi:hypothetical protein COO60DRAFT_722549 [Scenedesmus sp. NREL 46B-D3]|nr:hypothetical protein COO60DRAFT_722549 [Scenedesmus sp. NREL 46B-D3]
MACLLPVFIQASGVVGLCCAQLRLVAMPLAWAVGHIACSHVAQQEGRQRVHVLLRALPVESCWTKWYHQRGVLLLRDVWLVVCVLRSRAHRMRAGRLSGHQRWRCICCPQCILLLAAAEFKVKHTPVRHPCCLLLQVCWHMAPG